MTAPTEVRPDAARVAVIPEVTFDELLAARDTIMAHRGPVDASLLDALDTVVRATCEAGAVTVAIRTVSKRDRAGDKVTRFADDIRATQLLYDVAPWAMQVLVAHARAVLPREVTP